MNHKRGRPRKQVRCRLCTDGRDHAGGERQRRKQEPPEAPRVSNGKHWDWCPDCDSTGGGPASRCLLCGGTKIVDFIEPAVPSSR